MRTTRRGFLATFAGALAALGGAGLTTARGWGGSLVGPPRGHELTLEQIDEMIEKATALPPHVQCSARFLCENCGQHRLVVLDHHDDVVRCDSCIESWMDDEGLHCRWHRMKAYTPVVYHRDDLIAAAVLR